MRVDDHAADRSLQGVVDRLRLDAGRLGHSHDAWAAIEAIPATEWHERIATLGGSQHTLLVRGHFAFTGAQTDLLLGAMPPILRLRQTAGRNHGRWALERMREEIAEAEPGSTSMIRHLAHMLLIQTLRFYLASGAGRTTGWLFALSDPKVGRAAAAFIHRPKECVA